MNSKSEVENPQLYSAPDLWKVEGGSGKDKISPPLPELGRCLTAVVDAPFAPDQAGQRRFGDVGFLRFQERAKKERKGQTFLRLTSSKREK